ncbi:hypothetical protein ALC57_01722 [Trachymyrmex cornetzi]|uniref:Uncharacterized protein n=1 Tax=Trachymyrmex cornetzi TaxID=471704 RepID=A0A195ELK3_9HYME|nr:hypothetical protein ALC57_01722 [Trachymyrmex cornetzi]
MKLFTRPKCFSEAIALMTSLNCLLGLRAFEYPRGYSRPILSLIYLFFICGAYSCSSLYLERKYNSNIELMKLEYILYEVLTYITIVSVILKMLLGWWHTKKFKVCYKKIFEIDETLRQLGLSVNYNGIYFVTNGIIIIWIIIKLGIFELEDYAKIMNVEQKKHIFSKNMMFQLHRRKQSRTNVFVSEENKNRLVSQIGTEFLPPQFKKQLQSKHQNRSRRHSATMAKCQERKHLLQIIKQVHLELCKITKMVCTILGVQIAWEIGEIIVILTGSLYYFYIRYITQQYKALLEQTILILAFSFMSILKTIYLGCVCKNATNEANKTIEIIHAIYGCDADTDMQEEIINYCCCILKSVSTYVVIMIQMSHSLELNDNVQLDE